MTRLLRGGWPRVSTGAADTAPDGEGDGDGVHEELPEDGRGDGNENEGGGGDAVAVQDKPEREETDADAGSDTDADAGSGSDAGAGSGSETGPGSGSGSDSDADASSDTDVDAGSGSDTDAGSGSDAGSETGSGSDSETGPGSGSGSDSDADADAAPETGSDPDADPGSGEDAPVDEAGIGRPGRGRLWRAGLVAVAVVLVLGGCGFFYGAHQLRSTPSARNQALTDPEATTRVAGDVGNDLARVFSYTPDGLDATERSARAVLSGKAARQYTQLLARIRGDVTKQKVTLSTQAVRTGVVELDGDSARLLVFLDQVSRRGKDAPTTAAAQLTVTARWEKDQWWIVDIKAR